MQGPPGLTEKQLERAIVEMARFFGWIVFHARPAQTQKGWRTPVAYDGKGYPDLTLVGPRVVFAEIKALPSGKLSAEQVVWRDRIHAAGGEWYLWTSKEWQDGTVEKILAPPNHLPA
jgi:hypothetical protein